MKQTVVLEIPANIDDSTNRTYRVDACTGLMIGSELIGIITGMFISLVVC